MFSLSILRDVVAIVGVLIALAYYILTLKNQKRTRQAQLLMGLYEPYSSEESRKKSMEIQLWEWNTLDEFYEKYSNKNNVEAWSLWESKAAFFHGIGVLLEADMIDIELLDRLLTNSVNRHWNILRMGQVLVDWRRRMSDERSDYWVDPRHDEEFFTYIRESTFYGFDYLYHRLTDYRMRHPIKTTKP